ncbi:MAG TPA: precorrin-2 C(20)-methyltransferase [Stellaceae bacterium]|nr:precorrin-2 C(20)-methyltransferase [Stellaceae bacterium]
MERPGKLLGIGVGPGDPELITLKALRRLRAAPVVAYLAAKGRKGNAFAIVEDYLSADQLLVPLVFPVTTEHLPPPLCYERVIADFYDRAANSLAGYLDQGREVAVICEGDPLFYGSFMYLYDRLAGRYPTEIIPGVCSLVAAAAVLGAPLAYRNQSLVVLSGVLPEAELARRLDEADAAAILKLGSNFAKVRRVLAQLGLAGRARYVERATMHHQRSLLLDDIDPQSVPYFSMILVPGRRWRG